MVHQLSLDKSTGKIDEHLPEQMIDQPQVQPVPRQDTPMSRVSALAPTPQVVSPPSASISTQPAVADDVPKDTPAPPVFELETTPTAPPAAQTTSPDDSTVLAHKESEEPSAAPIRKQESASPAPTMLSQSPSESSPSTDDLPPLPTDLGTKPEVTDSQKQTLSPMIAPNTSTNSNSMGENELPPLPNDVSNSTRQGHDAPQPEMISEIVTPTAVPPAVQDLPILPDDSSGQESRGAR